MSGFDNVVSQYLRVWNTTDEAERRKAIDEVFAADVHYVDPLAEVEGRDALNALIGAVHEQFPGLVFTAGGPADAHHDQGRFTWHLGPEHLGPAHPGPAHPGSAGSEPLVIGFDVAELDAAGRIRRVVGFLDKVPV
jgi:hypothetical protein